MKEQSPKFSPTSTLLADCKFTQLARIDSKLGASRHIIQPPAQLWESKSCCSALGQYTNTADVQPGVTSLELTSKVTSEWHYVTASFGRQAGYNCFQSPQAQQGAEQDTGPHGAPVLQAWKMFLSTKTCPWRLILAPTAHIFLTSTTKNTSTPGELCLPAQASAP